MGIFVVTEGMLKQINTKTLHNTKSSWKKIFCKDSRRVMCKLRQTTLQYKLLLVIFIVTKCIPLIRSL